MGILRIALACAAAAAAQDYLASWPLNWIKPDPGFGKQAVRVGTAVVTGTAAWYALGAIGMK